MRATLIALFALMAACSGAALAQQEKEKIPRDFSVSAEWGSHGVMPDITRRLSLSQDPGKPGVYQLNSTTTTEDWDGARPRVNKKEQSWAIDAADARALHQLILDRKFFTLRNRYEPDEEEEGGGWLSVSVTADGRTKSVTANNVRVKALDAIRETLVLVRKKALMGKELEKLDTER